jgi:hypothetical protein
VKKKKKASWAEGMVCADTDEGKEQGSAEEWNGLVVVLLGIRRK